MSHASAIPAAEAFRRLSEGNERFLKGQHTGDASEARRMELVGG